MFLQLFHNVCKSNHYNIHLKLTVIYVNCISIKVKKNPQTPQIFEYQEIGTLLHCWWECEWYSLYGKQYGSFSRNDENYHMISRSSQELPHDPAIPLWDIYPKELKSGSQKDTFEILM